MIVYTGQEKKYVGKNARSFDVAKYMGKWYDVAHKPFKYQAPCPPDAQSTAFYRFSHGNTIQVTNRCGNQVAQGIARMQGDDPMRLEVSFGNNQPAGEYWIVMVDSYRYKWSVVSNSDRSLLWILSRTPKLSTATLKRLVNYLQRAGYNVSDLIYYSAQHLPLKSKGVRVWSVSNLEKTAIENRAFRKVETTAKHLQLVVMHLEAGQEIGAERHPDTDQFFRLEQGRAMFRYKYNARDNWTDVALETNGAFMVPAGTWHNVIAVTPVSLYTIYSSPKH